MSLKVRDGAAWDVALPKVRRRGGWERPCRAWYRENGIWNQFFAGVPENVVIFYPDETYYPPGSHDWATDRDGSAAYPHPFWSFTFPITTTVAGEIGTIYGHTTHPADHNFSNSVNIGNASHPNVAENWIIVPGGYTSNTTQHNHGCNKDHTHNAVTGASDGKDITPPYYRMAGAYGGSWIAPGALIPTVDDTDFGDWLDVTATYLNKFVRTWRINDPDNRTGGDSTHEHSADVTKVSDNYNDSKTKRARLDPLGEPYFYSHDHEILSPGAESLSNNPRWKGFELYQSLWYLPTIWDLPTGSALWITDDDVPPGFTKYDQTERMMKIVSTAGSTGGDRTHTHGDDWEEQQIDSASATYINDGTANRLIKGHDHSEGIHYHSGVDGGDNDESMPYCRKAFLIIRD